jgi:hypothetical protein
MTCTLPTVGGGLARPPQVHYALGPIGPHGRTRNADPVGADQAPCNVTCGGPGVRAASSAPCISGHLATVGVTSLELPRARHWEGSGGLPRFGRLPTRLARPGRPSIGGVGKKPGAWPRP